MVKVPVVKINTNFSQFSKFSNLFSNFKRDIATPKNIGLTVDKSISNTLKMIAQDLRVITQVQLTVIGNSKKFRESMKNLHVQPAFAGFPKVAPKIHSPTGGKLFGDVKNLSNSGFQNMFSLSARAFPLQTYGLWNMGQKAWQFGQRSGEAFDSARNIFTRVNNNPLVTAIRKLTMAITRLTIKDGFSTAISGVMGAVRSVPLIGGIAAGVATGGLFGIAASTSRSSNLRTQARDLGLTNGELQAGRNTWGQYVNFEDIVRNINEQRTKMGSGLFMVDGISRKDSNAEIFVKLMNKVASIGREHKGENAQYLGQNPILKLLGISPNLPQTLSLIPKNNFEENNRKFKELSVKLNQPDDILKRSQDLNTSLGVTADLLKNKFGMAIAAAAPQIEQLGKFIQDVVGKIASERNITNLLGGIKKIGDFVKDIFGKITGSDNIFEGIRKVFQESVFPPLKDFFQNNVITPLRDLFQNGLINPLRDLFQNGLINPLKNLFENDLINPFKDLFGKLFPDNSKNNDDPGYNPRYPLFRHDPFPEYHQAAYTVPNVKGYYSEKYKNGYLDSINKALHLPNKFMQAIRWKESGGNDFAVNRSSTAMGAFQMTAAARKDYGVKNPFNFFDIATGAGKDFKHLMDVFHDHRKAVVAYNWGEGNMAKYLRRQHENWEKNLPAPQHKYLNDIDRYLKNYQDPQNIHLNVNNNTGGSTSVNARMASGFPKILKGSYSI